MPDKDKGCVSVLPLMIYRAHGGRRLTLEEMVAFVAQYNEHCDSLKNTPMDMVFESTDVARRLDLQREDVQPTEPKPEDNGLRAAQLFQSIARKIRS